MGLVSIEDKALPSKCLLAHSDNSLLTGLKVLRKTHSLNMVSTYLHYAEVESSFMSYYVLKRKGLYFDIQV